MNDIINTINTTVLLEDNLKPTSTTMLFGTGDIFQFDYTYFFGMVLPITTIFGTLLYLLYKIIEFDIALHKVEKANRIITCKFNVVKASNDTSKIMLRGAKNLLNKEKTLNKMLNDKVEELTNKNNEMIDIFEDCHCLLSGNLGVKTINDVKNKLFAIIKLRKLRNNKTVNYSGMDVSDDESEYFESEGDTSSSSDSEDHKSISVRK